MINMHNNEQRVNYNVLQGMRSHTHTHTCVQSFLGLAQFKSQLALLTLQRGDGNSTCSHHVDQRDEYVYLYININIDIIYVLHIHILRIYSILSICIHR